MDNQIDLKAPRHFLFHVPFAAPMRGPLHFDLRALDYAHNETRLSVTWKLRPKLAENPYMDLPLSVKHLMLHDEPSLAGMASSRTADLYSASMLGVLDPEP